MVKEIKKPWGDFEEFTFNEKSTVKILEVNPHESLSLQKHKHRKETWFFLTEGYVQIRNKSKKIREGKLITIPRNTLHRLYAKDKEVKVLEISYGKFNEKDIIRVKDNYGRVKNKNDKSNCS